MAQHEIDNPWTVAQKYLDSEEPTLLGLTELLRQYADQAVQSERERIREHVMHASLGDDQ